MNFAKKAFIKKEICVKVEWTAVLSIAIVSNAITVTALALYAKTNF